MFLKFSGGECENSNFFQRKNSEWVPVNVSKLEFVARCGTNSYYEDYYRIVGTDDAIIVSRLKTGYNYPVIVPGYFKRSIGIFLITLRGYIKKIKGFWGVL